MRCGSLASAKMRSRGITPESEHLDVRLPGLLATPALEMLCAAQLWLGCRGMRLGGALGLLLEVCSSWCGVVPWVGTVAVLCAQALAQLGSWLLCARAVRAVLGVFGTWPDLCLAAHATVGMHA